MLTFIKKSGPQALLNAKRLKVVVQYHCCVRKERSRDSLPSFRHDELTPKFSRMLGRLADQHLQTGGSSWQCSAERWLFSTMMGRLFYFGLNDISFNVILTVLFKTGLFTMF